jgi:hypothetical protein
MLNPYPSQGTRADGRSKSCKTNAMRHGLRSEAIILPWESALDYEKFEGELLHRLAPVGEGEKNCVVGLAGCLWRLRRIPPAEAELICKEKQRVDAWNALRNLDHTPLQGLSGAPARPPAEVMEPESTIPTSSAYISGKGARRVLDYESGLLRNAKRWAALLRELQALRGGHGEIIDVEQDEPGDGEGLNQNLD